MNLVKTSPFGAMWLATGKVIEVKKLPGASSKSYG